MSLRNALSALKRFGCAGISLEAAAKRHSERSEESAFQTLHFQKKQISRLRFARPREAKLCFGGVPRFAPLEMTMRGESNCFPAFRSAFWTILIGVTALSCFLASALAANQERPLVLLFQTSTGKGADKRLAAETTNALQEYFRQTQRVNVTLFDRDSPVVLRAIMEKSLTPDSVASYANRKTRLEVAKDLGFPYAGGAEISLTGSVVHVKLWLAKVDGGRRGQWQTTGSASSIGAGNEDLDNAMQCAASTAVIDMAEKALMDLPSIPQPHAETTNATTAISSDQTKTPDSQGAPGASPAAPSPNYGAQGDKSVKSGDLALAIEQYSEAIDIDPNNVTLRIKLAETYAKRGMFERAYAEINRATSLGLNAAALAAARKQIDDMQSAPVSGSAASSASVSPAAVPSAPASDASTGQEVVSQPSESSPAPSSDTASAIDKIVDGDKLWKAGKLDSAAKDYQESIKLNPNDWRSHERLAVIYAAMSMFNESRKALQDLDAVQPNPPADVLRNRYKMFREAFDSSMDSIISLYDSNLSDFESSKMTHESFYDGVDGLSARVEAMSKFMDALSVPDDEKQAQVHRSLACGLMAQAASSLRSYLESNDDTDFSNAAVFEQQAKVEIQTAKSLDAK